MATWVTISGEASGVETTTTWVSVAAGCVFVGVREGIGLGS
jgi:hypothetical protein